MKLLVACLAFASACTGESTSNLPHLSGDRCGMYTTEGSCTQHATCEWSGPLPCGCEGSSDSSCMCSPDPVYECIFSCPIGQVCTIPLQPGCACVDDQVCFRDDGGPIGCVLPAQGTGDACARITGHGTCTDSPSVIGLCLCSG